MAYLTLNDAIMHAQMAGKALLDLLEHEGMVAHLAKLHKGVVHGLGTATLFLGSI